MIEYGDRMLDLREQREEFNMRDNPPFSESATYYATGAELKEAINIAFKDVITPYEAQITSLRGDRLVWVVVAVIQTLGALAGWGAYVWLP